MLQAYRDGKDLYVEIASISLHKPYNECLEHFPKGTPIKKHDNGKWYYAVHKETGETAPNCDYTGLNVDDYDYDKLADGDTDTYKDGKERRGQAKKILLGGPYVMPNSNLVNTKNCGVA